MAVLRTIGWPARLLICAVVAASVGTGVFLLVRASGNGEQPAALVATIASAASPTAVQPVATPTPDLLPTDAPTQPPATEAPLPTTTPPQSTLPPPPPKPEHPTEVQGGEWGSVPGGQWYRLLGCFDFYLPEGWTFSLQVIAVDPGGSLIAFTEKSSGAGISFYRDSLSERTRTDGSGQLGAAFDQMAATISNIC